MRVVIDTNVVISALLGTAQSPPRRLLFDCLLAESRFVLCLSSAVSSEYKRVFQYEKFRKVPGFLVRAEELLARFEQLAYFSEPTMRLQAIADEPDNRLLELAVEANAQFLVTGNTRDFTFSEFQGVRIVNPKEFVETHCV